MKAQYFGLGLLVLFIIMFNLDLILMNSKYIILSKMSFRLKKYSTKNNHTAISICESLNENELYNRKYIIQKGSRHINGLYEKIGVFISGQQFNINNSKGLLNQTTIKYIPIVHYIIEENNGKSEIKEYVNFRILTTFVFLVGLIFYCLIFSYLNPLESKDALFFYIFWGSCILIDFLICRYCYKIQKNRLEMCIKIK